MQQMWLNIILGKVKLKPMQPAANPIFAAAVLWGDPWGFAGM